MIYRTFRQLLVLSVLLIAGAIALLGLSVTVGFLYRITIAGLKYGHNLIP